MFSDPVTSGSLTGLPAVSQSQTLGSETSELPLFDLDPLSPLAEDQPITERDSPSPSPLRQSPSPSLPPHSPSPPPPPHSPSLPLLPCSPSPPLPLLAHEVDVQEFRAQEEIRQQFQWLADMLDGNRKRGWGTAYRDFADVLLLLRAVSGLGMVEQRNGRVSDGAFSASTGCFTLSLATFIDLMHLEHTSTTWRNKLTAYFRLKSLYLYSEHTGGVRFQSPAHSYTWTIVSRWIENRDKLLPEDWTTTRFGSTELRPLLRSMLQEACQSKHSLSLPPSHIQC